jgi:aspartate ammonia-lyase
MTLGPAPTQRDGSCLVIQHASIAAHSNTSDQGTYRALRDGIQANVERCNVLLNKSVIISTALVPMLGYEESARIAKLAMASARTVSETVQDLGVMTGERFGEVKRLACTFPKVHHADS